MQGQRRAKIEDGAKKFLEIIVIISLIMILSVTVGACAIVLTIIPCDLSLVEVALKDTLIVALNSWPIFCVMLITYFLCNKIWVSFLMTSTLVFIIAEVNRFKVIFRDDPFVFQDILLVNEAKDMLGRYSLYLDKVSFCAILFIILATVGCFFLNKIKLKNKCSRIAGVLVTGVLLVMSCNTLYFNNQEIYDYTWHYQFGNVWKYGNQYMARGVIYSFIRSIPSAFATEPEGYDEKEAEKALNSYDTVLLKDSKKVHIISIMLEAYNDFSVFEGVEFVEDPYQNFHEMQSQSYYGKLYTDIFAAGTITTERSFLTGYSQPSFSKKATESYVRYFKEQGYYTEAMHPSWGWFYDRRNVNDFLGFNNFAYYENTFETVPESELEMETYNGYVSDYDFFDYIMEGLERTVENNQMYFNFSVTYQNHGPYSSEQLIDTEYALRKEEYTEEEYNIFNNYLYGIAKTDKALGKLQDLIEQQEEPIVLILFGDHNPWLGENNSVYEMLGINLNLDTAEGAANYYQTPYLIYANKAAKESLQRDFKSQGETISPMFLMNEFFDCAGLEGPAYLNYLQDVKETYTVINPVYVKKDGQYLLRSKEEDSELLKKQEWVEFYLKEKVEKEKKCKVI